MVKYEGVRKFRAGSGAREVFTFIFKTYLPTSIIIFIIGIIILAVLTILAIIMGDMGLLIIGAIIFSFFLMGSIFFIPLMIIPTSLSSLIVWAIVKKGNSIYLTRDQIIVVHQNWSASPAISNRIPVSFISHIEKADERYWKERWDNTNLCWKAAKLHPLPPKGGLYPMYSGKKNLLLIFLKGPLLVRNLKLGAMTPLGLTINDHWVQEVILDIHPDDQDEFIYNVMKKNHLG